MARRDRIAILKRLASHTESDNARRLAERLRTLDTEERRLQQIRNYLAEYTATAGPGGASTNVSAAASAISGSAMTIGRLRSNRSFVERLRNAVDEQRGTVEVQRHQVEQQTAQWRTARARTRSLGLLGERQDQAARERLERREQAVIDELAISRNSRPVKR
ncbi:MAG: flagellar export protein FliJ [Gammaproteobacteria bacterium]